MAKASSRPDKNGVERAPGMCGADVNAGRLNLLQSCKSGSPGRQFVRILSRCAVRTNPLARRMESPGCLEG